MRCRAVRGASFAALALLVPLWGPLVGRALAGERLQLSWTGPAECPSESEVRAEVDRVLGSSRVVPAKPVEVKASVTRDEQGTYRAHLVFGGGAAGGKDLHGASCKAVGDAAALVIALAIDPEVVPPAPSPPPAASTGVANTPPPDSGSPSGPAPGGGPPDSQGAPDSGLPPNSGGPPDIPPSNRGIFNNVAPVGSTPPGLPFVAPPPRAGAPRLGSSWAPVALVIGAWAGGDVGTLPGVTAALGGTLGVAAGKQRFEIGFVYRFPGRAQLASKPGAGGDVSLVAGSLTACRTLLSGRLALAPCAGVEIGDMAGTGVGVTTPTTAHQPWFAGALGGRAWLSLAPRIALFAGLDAAIPFLRPRFVIEGLGLVHTPSPVSGRGSLGLEARF
ncbi:MAG: hypothetical protein U0441_16995 [Polyangiaceae bacterium]